MRPNITKLIAICNNNNLESILLEIKLRCLVRGHREGGRCRFSLPHILIRRQVQSFPSIRQNKVLGMSKRKKGQQEFTRWHKYAKKNNFP
jgi:hypothetical protein